MVNQLQVDFVLVGDGFVIYCQQFLFGFQVGLGGQVFWCYGIDDWVYLLVIEQGDDLEEQNCQQEIGDGISCDDGDLLMDCFVIEGLFEQMGWYFCFVFVEYFDVVVQWNGCYYEFGVVLVVLVYQWCVEVDGEVQDFYFVVLCDLEVVEFVECYQYIQGYQGVDDYVKCIYFLFLGCLKISWCVGLIIVW